MVENLNPKNFAKEVFESEVPVIVDFWAPWCGPCRMMAPVFEELSSEYSGKLKFTKLNVEEHNSFSSQFGIMGIPALKIFKGETVLGDIVGFNPKDALKQKIDSIIG